MLSDRSPEVVVEEKIKFDPTVIIANNVPSNYKPVNPTNNAFGKISIVRNLSADTFNLEYEKMVFGNNTLYPYANFSINGNGQETYKINHIVNFGSKDGKTLKAHRSLFADKKFHDLSSITLGYTLGIEPNPSDQALIMSRITTNPVFYGINKNINSNYKKVIHLKTIKAYEITKKTRYTKDEAESRLPAYKGINVVKKYNNIYLVPRELSRTSSNKTLFDIYMNNDDNRSIDGDNRIISKKLRTTSFGKEDVDTQVVADIDPKSTYQPINGPIATKIARVDIIGRSYYDFEKQKSVLGNNSKSVDGEIIPYSLKGEYSRDLDISFNDTFKNMKIHLAKNFDRAILDPDEGTVQLKINAMRNKPVKEWHKLNDQNIKRIKKGHFSLGGLERL